MHFRWPNYRDQWLDLTSKQSWNADDTADSQWPKYHVYRMVYNRGTDYGKQLQSSSLQGLPTVVHLRVCQVEAQFGHDCSKRVADWSHRPICEAALDVGLPRFFCF